MGGVQRKSPAAPGTSVSSSTLLGEPLGRQEVGQWGSSGPKPQLVGVPLTLGRAGTHPCSVAAQWGGGRDGCC